jgi:hypothetical protein
MLCATSHPPLSCCIESQHPRPLAHESLLSEVAQILRATSLHTSYLTLVGLNVIFKIHASFKNHKNNNSQLYQVLTIMLRKVQCFLWVITSNLI